MFYDMWTSLCNFLFAKLFRRPENESQRSNDCNDRTYGKRLKLSNSRCGISGLLHQTDSPRSDSMLEKNDTGSIEEEDECCVIAEIPRRKKAGNSSSCLPSKESTDKKDSTSFIFKRELMEGDKEIEVLNSSSSSLSLYKIKSVSKSKFFHNQRLFLSQSKMAKSRLSFRKHLKKNMNFLQESYRLKEKFQYMQLLQSQTSNSLLALRPSSPKRLLYEPEIIPIIDLTNDDDKSLVPLRSRKMSEQEVQILKEVPRIRSFQDVLRITPFNGTKRVHEMLLKHSKSTPKLMHSIDNNTISLLGDEEDQKSDPEDLEEKLRTFMQITTFKVKQPEIIDEIYFVPELTKEQEEKIQVAMEPEPSQEVLVEGFGLSITRRDMHTLVNLNWLNDEVINFYMNLIMERSKENKTLLKVYAFNTFFYPKLVSKGYLSLRRWTKQVDVFSYDLILVPIHLGMHWCLSVIDFRSKSIEYYDSVGSPNNGCLERLLLYLKSESLDKKNKIFPAKDWKKLNMEDIPQQMNGSDCGVFSCMFAEHLARDCKILFSQDHMPYFRKKMIFEILEKKLLT